MNKILLLTALVGAATAQYTNMPNGRTFAWAEMNSYFKYQYSFDVNYAFGQDSGAVAGKPDLWSQNVAFTVDSVINVVFDIEVAKLYHYTLNLALNPITITPYQQVITWVRPESVAMGIPFDIQLKGNRNIAFMTMTTKTTNNFALPSQSLVTWLIDGFSAGNWYVPIPYEYPTDFVFNGSPTTSTDPIFSFDLIGKLFDPANNPILAPWYGAGSYYTWQMGNYAF